jgi:alanine racemase
VDVPRLPSLRMTVRLTIRRRAWEAHVRTFAASVPGLVPVVKGNGYGFGRAVLHPVAATLARRVCVGSVHELDGIAPGVTPIVLTPTLAIPPCVNDSANDTAVGGAKAAVLTVGSLEQVAALDGWSGSVVVKLRSSMQRHGIAPDELGTLADAIDGAGLRVDSAAIHLPLAGDDTARRVEIEQWLTIIPSSWMLSVSHLAPDSFAALRAAHPHRRFELRAGTALWHGDKSFLHLDADVLDVRPVDTDRTAATTAGYHATPVPFDGALVMIGAGSANGIAPLADGRSPFHFAHQRITLLEPPHMHTSIGIVPAGQPWPVTGDRVDVQRPLILTTADEFEWLP